MLKNLRVLLWGLVAIAAVGAGYLMLHQQPLPGTTGANRTLPGAAKIGGPFALTSHKGDQFDSSSLQGKPYLVFFGFTHCPDICPTTLLDVSKMLTDLGEPGKDIQAVFITIDPERDTPEALGQYMTSFDPRITALTGSPEDIAKVAKLFFAQYEKVPAENSSDPKDYTMNHTATVFLMDRKGNLAGTLGYGEKPDVAKKKLARLIK